MVYTDSLEPKESTQKQFLMQFKRGIENGKEGENQFYVLRTDPESAYLKTEQEVIPHHQEPFTFNNTIHSDRQKDKNNNLKKNQHGANNIFLEKKPGLASK